MRRIWQIRGFALLLIGGALATFAWGETVELVTYFPTTAQAGDLHLRSLTVGDGVNNEAPLSGDLLVESRLAINATMADIRGEDRLFLRGRDDLLDLVLFLPGADNFGVPGVPRLRVGIGTTDVPFVPVSPLANTDTNIVDEGGTGISGAESLAWRTNSPGYALGVANDSLAVASGGLLVRIRGDVTQRILTLNSGLDNGTDRFVVLGAGQVGIGTVDPLELLHLTNNFPSTGLLVSGDAPRLSLVDTTVPGFLDVATAASWHIDNWDDRFRIFRQPNRTTAGSEALTAVAVPPFNIITNNPAGYNIGIGTTNPLSTAPAVPNGLTGNLDANDIFLRSTGQFLSQLAGGAAIITGTYVGNGGGGRRTIVVPGISAGNRIRFLVIVEGAEVGGATPFFLKSNTMPGSFHYINANASSYRSHDAEIRLENNGFSISRNGANGNKSGRTFHYMAFAG